MSTTTTTEGKTPHPQPTTAQLAEAARLRSRAQHSRNAAEASFQRSDTDGFLTQWGHGLTGQRDALQAKILEQGGHERFVGLFRIATGERVPARMISTEFGARWMICDPGTGRATGVFYPTGPRSRRQRWDGLEERVEWATAKAMILGRGTGLSGSAWVEAVRTDGGWPGAPR